MGTGAPSFVFTSTYKLLLPLPLVPIEPDQKTGSQTCKNGDHIRSEVIHSITPLLSPDYGNGNRGDYTTKALKTLSKRVVHFYKSY